MISQLKVAKIVVFALVCSTLSVQAQEAKTWKIDKAHTSVNFTVNHLFSEVTGKFKSFDGTINFDEDNLKESKFTFSVDVKSIETDDEDRNHHLMSEDFFNVKAFPKITFVSTKIEKVSEKKYLAYGKLTIRDVTKNVKLPFKVTGEMENPWKAGTKILGLKFETTIDRTDYGVGSGSWAATAVVGDEVTISIPLELDGDM